MARSAFTVPDFVVRSVRTVEGKMQLTRTLDVRASYITDSESPARPNFDAQYAPPPEKPRFPAVEEMFTMCPRFLLFIPGRTARVMRNGPRRLTAMIRSKTTVSSR